MLPTVAFCSRLSHRLGAVACQLLDAIYPRTIALQLRFTRRNRSDETAGFLGIDSVWLPEELQSATVRDQQEEITYRTFLTDGINEKDFDMASLSKQSSKESYDFLSTMKEFFDNNYPGGFYDAIGRRRESKGTASTAY